LEREFRICSECGKIMFEGYVIEGGWKYYCSDTCLEKNYTRDEFNEMYGDGDTETYYTEW
jgi:hypothetical protein